MQSYEKTPKTFREQVSLLKERGLIILNEEKAVKVLSSISYNRLSEYWYPLLKEPKDKEIFQDGADFETIFKTYQFDGKLSAILSNRMFYQCSGLMFSLAYFDVFLGRGI